MVRLAKAESGMARTAVLIGLLGGLAILYLALIPWIGRMRAETRRPSSNLPPAPVLLCRVAPNPVALLFVEPRLAGRSAIILFIPADRVEHEQAAVGSAIFERLAGDDVGG